MFALTMSQVDGLISEFSGRPFDGLGSLAVQTSTGDGDDLLPKLIIGLLY
jgi:hypothetical protein